VLALAVGAEVQQQRARVAVHIGVGDQAGLVAAARPSA
jgi:hypothetical protein